MQKEYTIQYQEFEDIEQLEIEDQKLLLEAKKASNMAYAPYSHFHVGAALLLDDGTIVTGNNQENSAYPSGLCAERVALFSASSLYPTKKTKTIAITAKSENIDVNFPISPCGGCRQVMAEYENLHQQKLRVIMQGDRGNIIIVNGVSNLLPFVFNGDFLKRKHELHK